MARTLLYYSIALAAPPRPLQWVEYRFLAHAFPFEIYLALVAVAFLALGSLGGTPADPAPGSGGFEVNHAAIRSLGLTPRECGVERLASGQSNKELARARHLAQHRQDPPCQPLRQA